MHATTRPREKSEAILTLQRPLQDSRGGTSCLVIRPVDKLDHPPMRVSMDRVVRCPEELPDVSRLEPRAKGEEESAQKEVYDCSTRRHRPPLPPSLHKMA